jgi:hypothetical protein
MVVTDVTEMLELRSASVRERGFSLQARTNVHRVNGVQLKNKVNCQDVKFEVGVGTDGWFYLLRRNEKVFGCGEDMMNMIPARGSYIFSIKDESCSLVGNLSL